MRFSILPCAALLLGMALAPSHAFAADAAVTAKPLSPAERTAIEGVIKDYLTKEHPEVIMDAVQELQKRDEANSMASNAKAIASSSKDLYDDPHTPVGGNPKGDVKVVEFFDYQCPYCKGVQPAIDKLLKDDHHVKFIYKEFPILGEISTEATKAALASVKQGKYLKFHDALMKAPFSHNANPPADEKLLWKTAKDAGLNIDKLKKDMKDPEIEKIVDGNLKLGATIGVRGTPMFVINDKMYPGAMEYAQFKSAVDDAHAAAKKK